MVLCAAVVVCMLKDPTAAEKKLPWQKAVDIPPTLAGTLLGGFLPLSHINLWFIERFPPKRIANQKGLCT